MEQKQPAGEDDWGTLLKPKSQGDTQVRKVGAISQDFIRDAAKKGPLSMEAHQQQMVVVDGLLNKLVSATGYNVDNVLIIIRQFMEHVQASNKKIGEFCHRIIDRGTAGDPTLTVGEVTKATAIVQFAEDGVSSMHASSNLALDLVSKGGEIINKQIAGAVVVIFDARLKEMALFSAKVDIFHKQEEHDLKIMLAMQKARLEEQQQLFGQMKEVVQMNLDQKNKEKVLAQEQKKLELEHQIKVMGVDIHREEVAFQAAFADKKLASDEQLETKRIDTDGRVKDHAIEADKEAQQWAAIQRRMGKDKKSEDQKQAAMAESKNKKEAEIVGSIAGAAKPQCCIQ